MTRRTFLVSTTALPLLHAVLHPPLLCHRFNAARSKSGSIAITIRHAGVLNEMNFSTDVALHDVAFSYEALLRVDLVQGEYTVMPGTVG